MTEKWITRFVFFLALLAVLLAGTTYYVTYHLKDQLVPLVLSEINQRMKIRIHIEDANINFLRTFPHASVTLINTTGFAHPDCQLNDFKDNVSDTLFHFHRIDLRFNIRELLQQRYVMNQISLMQGSIQLLTDQQGLVNYQLFETQNEEQASFELDIRQFHLRDIHLHLHNLQQRLLFKSDISQMELSGRFNQSRFDMQAAIRQTTYQLVLDQVALINQATPWNASSSLSVADSSFLFSQTQFSLKQMDFLLDGRYIHTKKPHIDLVVQGNKLSVKDLISIVPDAYRDYLPTFQTSGDLDIQISANGPINSREQPNIEARLSLHNGKLRDRKLHITNLNLDASFNNGKQRTLSGTTIEVKKFGFTLQGSSQLNGSGRITNLKKPLLELTLNTDMDLSHLQQLIPTDYQLQGTMKTTSYFKSNLHNWNEWNSDNFYYITLNSEIEARDIHFQHNKLTLESTSFSANWQHNTIRIDSLEGIVNSVPLLYTGEIRNATFALFREHQPLDFSGDLHAGHLNMNTFLPEKKNTTAQDAISLPDHLYLKLNCHIDQFTINDLTLRAVSGQLDYQPYDARVRALEAKSLNGYIKGETRLVQTHQRFSLNAQTTVSGLDIRQFFRSFGSFGQTHLTHEHITGVLSGSIDFSSELDSLLQFDMPSMLAAADITIEKGQLHDLEMLYSLSRFIDIEELQDIHFETLQNRIEIKHSRVIIPSMSIRSSAVEMEASGIHHFNNTYSYHLSILLSDILSRKAKRKEANNEFGVIADDGIRTMLPLKIEGRENEYRVSYDRKQAAQKVREDLRQEKESLRSLFREEFGKEETSKETHKEDFIIEWEETPDSNLQQEPDKKENNRKAGVHKQNKEEEKKFLIEWE